MADISGQLCSTDDFECEKTLMWGKGMVDFGSQHKKQQHFCLLFIQGEVHRWYN